MTQSSEIRDAVAVRAALIRAISDPGATAGLRGWRSMAEWTADAILALSNSPDVDDLAWFSARPTLSLDHYSPWFCAPWFSDDDDLKVEWRVSQVSGPRDEREYDIVGRGETAAEAIKAARAFFHQSAPPSAPLGAARQIGEQP